MSNSTLRIAAGALFAIVLAVVYGVSDPVQAGGLLFVVPIALLAISDGRRGGIAGALLATGLVALWVTAEDIEMTALGWGSRVVSFSVIGFLGGHYVELARAVERRRLDERYAVELHDRVVQQLVVARYQLDDGHPAWAPVDDALAGAKEIITGRLGHIEAGDLRLSDAPRPPADGGPAVV